MGHALSVVVAIAIPVSAGLGVGLSIKEDVQNWYKKLKKPNWCPPDWAFGPVWTALYTAMGYASYLVWRNGNATLPLSLYGVQLILNLAWSPIFFRKKEIGYALLDITALLGVLGATIVEFNKISATASYLLLPYLAWTSYATALTADIYRRNPQARGEGSQNLRTQAEDVASKAADRTSELASAAAEKASHLSEKIKANQTSDKAGDKAEDARRNLEDTAEQADSGARKSATQIQKGT